MKRDSKRRRVLFLLRSYVTFFLLIAFIITCCMMLFLNILRSSLQITYDEENLRMAAVLTMGNVILLSLLCTVIDAVRRRYMVERPVQRIILAAEKVMQGDLSARIEPFHSIDRESGFDMIIDYFNRMTAELEGLETLRTDFIANVSHELKTPLSVMQNYGTMLQNPELTEGQRIEYAKAITVCSRRLADLITNILKLNRLENQQIYREAQTYNLGEQLCECLLNFEDVWEKKGIELDTDIEEDVLVESDRELLALVWNNLFSNAFKFTEKNGKVRVSLKIVKDMAVVAVADTGCGISPNEGKHIFEKFYQGDTSHAAQGNGLGLALVKRVVDIVSGEIAVESKVGEGSVFTVAVRRKADEKTGANA